jgi:lysozyme family protein
MDYNTAFDRLIGNEGGYVNNPNDPGGETNWGITLPILNQAIGANIVPVGTTISGLTREQSKIIYKHFFWDAGKMDQFDAAISFQVFDFAVNSGIETALRKLQTAVGVADDGNIGPVTITAIKSFTPAEVIVLFIAERLDFWRKLSKWPLFGNGWAGRAAADLRYAAKDI